jgi:SAM-dependent methyltransferase
MNRDTLRYYAGASLARLFPAKLKVMREAFTLPRFGNHAGDGRVERLIRYYVGEKASRHPGELESLHKTFWRRQTSNDWYAAAAWRQHEHASLFSDAVERCVPIIRQRQIKQVCEFGSGDGQWLNFLSQQWREPTEFIGIDLSEDQTQANRERYPNLRFECADLTHWVQDNARPNSLFTTHSGVLQYLSQPSLSTLLETIAQRAPHSLLFLIESLADDFDLDRESQSRPGGYELLYSHNYPERMRAAGMVIEFQEEIRWREYRMFVIVASTRRGCEHLES